MARIQDIWTDPSDFAIADKMTGALTEILRGDADLSNWTDNRIFRMAVVDPGFHLVRVPDIQVAAVSTTQQNEPVRVIDETTALMIQLRWPIFQPTTDITQATEATVIQHIQKLIELDANCLLGGTSISVEPLAHRYEGFEFLDFEAVDLQGKPVMVFKARAVWKSERIRAAA